MQVDLINPHPRPSGGAHADVRGSITSLAKPLLTASMLEAGDDKELDSLPGMRQEAYLGEKWQLAWTPPPPFVCPCLILPHCLHEYTTKHMPDLLLLFVTWWSCVPPLYLPHVLFLAMHALAVFFWGSRCVPFEL